MNSEQSSNFLSESNENLIKDIDTSINRMQNMLDWILTTRENVANMNLELYTLFKPIEAFLEENNVVYEDSSESECVLQKDCQTIITKVASKLSKISDDADKL